MHWPSPLDVPDEIAAKSRAELPEACVCPLTMGVMRLPAITPRGTSYEYEVRAVPCRAVQQASQVSEARKHG